MSAVTVPVPPSRSPVRWSVVVWRLIGTGAVVLVALAASAFPVFAHSWNTGEATIICPEPHEVYPNSEVAEVRASASWGNGSWCAYLAPNGRQVGQAHSPAGLGERNIFEPRFSFVAVAVVLVVIWGLALGAIWLIWHVGRARRLPRDVGRVLVA